MKVLKLKSHYSHPLLRVVLYNPGRLFTRHGHDSIALATPTEPTKYISGSALDLMIKEDRFEEVDLVAERWVHPHLFKALKKEFEKEQ
jgi:hypothetical protein